MLLFHPRRHLSFQGTREANRRKRSRRLEFELLEDRTAPSVTRYVPGAYDLAWMRDQSLILLSRYQDETLTEDQFRGQWVVQIHPGLDGQLAAAAMGAQFVASQTALIENTYIVRFDAASATASIAYGVFEYQVQHGFVSWFYPLLTQQADLEAVPNDTFYPQQWQLRNTGQTGGTPGQDANLEGAWDLTRGNGVVIAVIDEGFQYTHPDLSPNAWLNPGEIPGNGIDDDGNGLIDDIRGWDFNGDDNDPAPQSGGEAHATAVGGIAAARGFNNLGVSGAAPEAQLVGLRLIAGGFTDAEAAAAFNYKNQHVFIYNNSWGVNSTNTLINIGPLAAAAYQNGAAFGRGGKGSIFVRSGGNNAAFDDDTNYNAYRNSRFAIAVAAVDHNGVRSSYSNRGAPIIVAAPSSGAGVGTVTTDLVGSGGYNNGSSPGDLPDADYTNTFGGTSSAAPLVAGVVANMLAANPNLSYRAVQWILATTARKNHASDPDWVQNGAGYWVNHNYGFGVVDATAAVNKALAMNDLPPEQIFSPGLITVNQAIPDNNATGLSRTAVVPGTSDFVVTWAEVEFSATHTRRGDLRVELTSPAGTVSRLALPRSDTGDHYSSWKFTSYRHAGERAAGTWTLKVSDERAGTTGSWGSWKLNLYGFVATVAADDDGYVVDEDSALTVSAAAGVLKNDSDFLNAGLTAVLFTNAVNGNVVLNADGSFTYTPNPDYSGPDSFTYQALGSHLSNVATVWITVTPTNDAPIAVNDGIYLAELGTMLSIGGPGVLANDIDPEGDALTAVLQTSTSNGVLNLQSNGSFTYTPNPGFSGFDTFTYKAFDGTLLSATAATVTIQVNSRPVANPDSYGMLWNQQLVVPVAGVLGNDFDFDGDPLTAELVTNVTRGTLNFLASGGFIYTPGTDFFGVDSFTYRVRDPYFLGNTVTVTITVDRPPLAGDDTFTVSAGQLFTLGSPGVLWNDVDLLGNPLTAQLVSGPGFGALTLGPDGSFQYLPGNNFVGTDTFTYRALTQAGFASNVATVRLVVTPPPTAGDDQYEVLKDQPLIVGSPGVLANDSGPGQAALSAVLFSGPTNGTLNLNGNGGFVYTPFAQFAGTDVFRYRASNGVQLSAVATVTIVVVDPALTPTARDDSYGVQRDRLLSIPGPGVLVNDSDPQGFALSAQLVSGPASGSLQLNGDGSVQYLPASGFTGEVSFQYRAINSVGLASNVATVRITVTPGPSGSGQTVVVGADAGFEPRVKVFDGSSGTEKASFLAFESSFLGGVRVATGDVNGDGAPDIVVGSGPGRRATVRVFDGLTYEPLAGVFGNLSPYGTFTGGVFVAVGDVNGDGTADLVTGRDAGGSPQVRVFNGKTGIVFSGARGSFLAYPNSFRGGVRVAAGDINLDGKAEVIVAPGVGAIAGGQTGLVKTFDLTRLSKGAPFVIQQFVPYESTFTGGVFVSAGQLDGDGRTQIVTTSGLGRVGEIKVFEPNTTVAGRSVIPLAGYSGGLRVGVGDVDGDGRADLIVGTGGGTLAKVRFYDAITLAEMFAAAGGLTPFAGHSGGLWVAGVRAGP